MNLTGHRQSGNNSVTFNAANLIHNTISKLPGMERSYADEGGWIAKLECMNENAVYILKEVNHNTDCCRGIKGNLINRNVVHEELQILAKDINIIIKYVFDLLVRKPRLDIEIRRSYGQFSIKKECAKLQIRADEMIFKSVRHDDYAQVLLFLAAKSDLNSPLNHIPKELINIFATTLFEVKLHKAIKDSRDF